MLRVISEISEIFSNFQCISIEHILISESETRAILLHHAPELCNLCRNCLIVQRRALNVPGVHARGELLWLLVNRDGHVERPWPLADVIRKMVNFRRTQKGHSGDA
jgi:hypothetical protein